MRANPRPVAGPGQGDSLSQWFADLPIVTKILFTGTFLQGAMVSFGMLNPMSVYMSWPHVTGKFEIWRLFSSFMFAGKFSFPFAMHLYVLYENSLRYERNPYNTGAGGTSSDYLYMIVIGMGILLLVDYFQGMGVLSEPLLYMIMYVWSRREPTALLNVFGFKFQSVYLPWVYIAIRMVMGSDILSPLIGIGTGHMYFFLIEVMPGAQGGQVIGNMIKTPGWCVRVVELLTARSQPRFGVQGGGVAPATNRGGNTGGFSSAAAALREQAGGGTAAGNNQPLPPQNRYNWGSGRTLGRN